MINHRRDRGEFGHADPYPVHTLKRVERPTTPILDDQVQRVDERESGFMRAGRGDFGPRLKKEYFRFVQKQPLSNALVRMGFSLRKLVDGPVASKVAPMPDDPLWMAGHIKETAYFLRADLVGYGKPDNRKKWWLDLEEVDGKLHNPPSLVDEKDHQASED